MLFILLLANLGLIAFTSFRSYQRQDYFSDQYYASEWLPTGSKYLKGIDTLVVVTGGIIPDYSFQQWSESARVYSEIDNEYYDLSWQDGSNATYYLLNDQVTAEDQNIYVEVAKKEFQESLSIYDQVQLVIKLDDGDKTIAQGSLESVYLISRQ